MKIYGNVKNELTTFKRNTRGTSLCVWEKSKFHVSSSMLWFFALISVGINIVQTFLLTRNISKAAVIGNLCIFAFAIAYGFLLEKKVTMEISYEES